MKALAVCSNGSILWSEGRVNGVGGGNGCGADSSGYFAVADLVSAEHEL